MTDERRHPSLLEDIVREFFITHGLPWFKDILTGRREENKKKKGDKTTFAQAMAKLKVADANAHDKILDFTGDHLKNRPTDQEDFEVNAARTGPTVEDTVEFLKLVGSLPDHDAREVFLNAIGYIGARSVDIKEHALKLASDLKKWVENLPSKFRTKRTKLTDRIKAADDRFEQDWKSKGCTVHPSKTAREESKKKLEEAKKRWKEGR